MGLTEKDMLALNTFHKAFADLDAAGVDKTLQLTAALKIASREAFTRFMPEDTFIIAAAESYRQLVSRAPSCVLLARESSAEDMGFKDSETAENAVRADWKVALVEIDVRQQKRIEGMTGVREDPN